MGKFLNSIYKKKKKKLLGKRPHIYCQYFQAFLFLSQRHESECYHLFLQECLQKIKFLEMLNAFALMLLQEIAVKAHATLVCLCPPAYEILMKNKNIIFLIRISNAV